MRLMHASAVLLATLLLSACANQGVDTAVDGKAESEESLAVANPAAVHCVEQGYELLRAGTVATGSTLMCVDAASGQKCPIWKFYREECQLPGRDS